ncbi:MAG: N-acetyl-gamma-glutamyl-phosphate reductase [Bradymonadaceae bacterium]
MSTQGKKRLGIVGARGHTGSELLRLLAGHDGFEIAFVSSRELAGEPVRDHVPELDSDLRFEDVDPRQAGEYEADAYVLALPNDLSRSFVKAIDFLNEDAIIVDLSADHRFLPHWQYGLPERFREQIRSATRIANPGCYATGMQLTLYPLLDILNETPHVFGVSGYSGAGTKPSPKNDLNVLSDNLMPYALSGHVHEREVSFQLARAVHFMPHVAPFFRGITLTISTVIEPAGDPELIYERLQAYYENEPLVRVIEDTPLVKDNAGKHHVTIGGITMDDTGYRLVLVATLDNLLKGAATQALQNLNLASGFDELEGIT